MRYAFLVIALLTIRTSAQISDSLAYQACLTEASAPVQDGLHEVTFSLFQVPIGGTSVWSETKTVQTKDCVFDTYLGSGESLAVDFGSRLWLGIQVGERNELVPRSPLVPVPQAKFAVVSARSLQDKGSGYEMVRQLQEAVELNEEGPWIAVISCPVGKYAINGGNFLQRSDPNLDFFAMGGALKPDLRTWWTSGHTEGEMVDIFVICVDP